jgi:hypothetical protein
MPFLYLKFPLVAFIWCFYFLNLFHLFTF